VIDGDVIGHRIVSSIYLSADSAHESSSHFLDVLLVATPACNPTISFYSLSVYALLYCSTFFLVERHSFGGLFFETNSYCSLWSGACAMSWRRDIRVTF